METPPTPNKAPVKTPPKPSSSAGEKKGGTPGQERVLPEGVHVLAPRDRQILDTLPLYGDEVTRSTRGEKYLREYALYRFINIEYPGKHLNFLYGEAGRSVNINLKSGELHYLPRYIALHVNSRKNKIYAKERINCEEKLIPDTVSCSPRFSLMEVDE